ncbi:MAG: hypothetical protein NPIRA05_17140 [Nitrospirales bacterium]|nr:MAG: hypothetical protein NPIRA05_17140 [Nitrospirales bacterium]
MWSLLKNTLDSIKRKVNFHKTVMHKTHSAEVPFEPSMNDTRTMRIQLSTVYAYQLLK